VAAAPALSGRPAAAITPPQSLAGRLSPSRCTILLNHTYDKDVKEIIPG